MSTEEDPMTVPTTTALGRWSKQVTMVEIAGLRGR